MGLVDNFRKLPTAMIILHIASKAIIGFGLGILLASYLRGFGGWIILLGIALSILPIYKILTGK